MIPYSEIMKYKYNMPPLQKMPIFRDERVMLLSEIDPSMKIVDFGCGKGVFYNETLMAKGFTGEYVGIDVDPSLVTNFPLYKSVEEFIDAHKYREFDALMMMNIIEHLPIQETYNVIKTLNPYIDGKIIIMTPNPQCFDYMFVDPEHISFYPYYYLYGLLKHFDFEDVEVWRGKGLYQMREEEGKRNVQIRPRMLEMNAMQRKVCIAMGLDWYGNLMAIGERGKE